MTPRDTDRAEPPAAGWMAGGPDAWPLAAWREMSNAPLDNTLMRLLVKFDNNGIEETEEPTATIGAHNDGEWNFVGWDWYRDEWTRGSGDLLGWLPMVAPQAAIGAPTDYSELSREQLERHCARMAQALSDDKSRAFWTRYALGPLAAPSCLCCGRLPEKVAIQHMELPGIVICEKCRLAALAAPPVAPQTRAGERDV